MPTERDNKVFLNTEESYTLLGISYLTFKQVEKDYGLQAKTFLGKQRQRFFLEEALKLIHNSSTDEATVSRIRAQIAELQKEQS